LKIFGFFGLELNGALKAKTGSHRSNQSKKKSEIHPAPPSVLLYSLDFFSFRCPPDSSCASRGRGQTTTSGERGRSRSSSHVDVAEADTPQGHRPRRQRVSTFHPRLILALPFLFYLFPARGSDLLNVGFTWIDGSVDWFGECRVGKTSLMNQYP